MSRIAFRPIIASLALTLAAGALSGTALAAVGDTPTGAPAAHGPMGKGPTAQNGHRWQEMRDALWLPGVGPIGKKEVDQLKLDTNQQALFKSAQDAQRDLRKSMREAGKTRHDALNAQVQAGKLDPHALADQEGQSRQQFQGQFDQVRQKWLAVWDGLNDGQRQQVTQFIKARQARWEARKESHPESHPRPGHRSAPPAADGKSAS